MKFQLLSSDDASSNSRLYAHFCNVSAPGLVLVDRMLCLNHQTNLAMFHVYTTLDMGFLRTMFTATSFLMMGAHFYRCCLSVRNLANQVETSFRPIRRVEVLLASQMKQYLLSLRDGT